MGANGRYLCMGMTDIGDYYFKEHRQHGGSMIGEYRGQRRQRR